MRNISVPQRSQRTFSSPVQAQRGGAAAGFDRMGWARRFCGTGFVGSDIGKDYKLKSMDLPEARERMVATQIAGRGVRDARVLAAMRDVPRHRFVPEAVARDAYDDRPLPIGEGQTISQPYMVAAMTAALAPGADRSRARGRNRVGLPGRDPRPPGAIGRDDRAPRRRSPRARPPTHGRAGDLERARRRWRWLERVSGRGALRPDPRHGGGAGGPGEPRRLSSPTAAGSSSRSDRKGSSTLMRRRPAGGPLFSASEGEGCVFVPLIGEHGWPERSLVQHF